jgi:hypothetical protein
MIFLKKTALLDDGATKHAEMVLAYRKHVKKKRHEARWSWAVELLAWRSPVWRVGSGRREFSSGLLLGGEVVFVGCIPIGSAKVRSYLQTVWYGGGVACIAPSESSLPNLSVSTMAALVSAVFLVGGIIGELSHLVTLSVLWAKA